MKALVRMIALFAFCQPALAMENIEADAAYERGIREQIRQELTQGLKLLKVQADGLGMEVREKDVVTLQQHMYEKAIMMGRCVDKAITFKKTVSDKILLDRYVKECIETHMKFISWLQTQKKWTNSLLKCSYDAKKIGVGSNIDRASINSPYDFLSIKDQMPWVTDYVTMKDCYDNRSETDKLLER